MNERLLSLSDVLSVVPVASSTWRQWVKDGKAPAPVKYGRRTFWRSSDVQQFTSGNWPGAGQESQPKTASSHAVQ
mgnify:CR=1 FL=1